ncbi:MAG: killer suppression protein HigA [Ignavibacteria bacterium]|nr:killer suppression protein HigA [Ignavibacteria bacterium]
MIHLKGKKLTKSVNSYKTLIKIYGNIMAKKIKNRLDDLRAAETLEDTRYLPGRYHELVGDRKGQWACDLEHPKRLIFAPTVEPIPIDKDGKYKWSEIKEIIVLEIIDYH